jgi:protein gp37
LHECKYCYARKIATRFEGTDSEVFDEEYRLYAKHELKRPLMLNGKKAPYPYGFAPTFHEYRLNEFVNKKGRNIFVCSMADLFGEWVPDEWIMKIFRTCEGMKQHNFLFLTKNPKRYIQLESDGQIPAADNFWFGSSVTKLADKYTWFTDKKFQWVIVGAETGNRKEKVIPERSWIEALVDECKKYNIPIFMKSSLEKIWGEPLIQEFPKELKMTKK